MLSKLSEKDIDEIHIIFTIIDRALISDEVSIKILTYYHEKEHEHYIYLEWLLLRWVFLRTNANHLPQRIKPILNINNYIIK